MLKTALMKEVFGNSIDAFNLVMPHLFGRDALLDSFSVSFKNVLWTNNETLSSTLAQHPFLIVNTPAIGVYLFKHNLVMSRLVVGGGE